jgi:hypothetical protein
MRTSPDYLARIRKKYNEIEEVWEKTDRWHAWSKRQVEQEMVLVKNEGSPEERVTSVGFDLTELNQRLSRVSR